MDREALLEHLRKLKKTYQQEGFVIEGIFGSALSPETDTPGDIDLLVHTTPEFSRRYRFDSIRRYREIGEEIAQTLGYPVDLASSTGMGETARKYILEKTLYL